MTVHARVQITIEVDVPDSWGEECKLDQVKKQATEKVEQLLRQGFIVHQLTMHPGPRSNVEARIIGEPKVTAIMVESK